MARRRRRRHSIGARRSRRSHRRRRALANFANPPRRLRRRRYGRRRHLGRRRRNPGLRLPSGRGIVGQVVQGSVNAVWLLVGEAGTNVITGFVPVDKSGAMGAVVKVGAAVATSWLLRRFVSTNAAQFALAGGLATVIRTPIKNAGVPFLSANLGDEPGYYAVGAGAYPSALPAMGAYPGSDYLSGDDSYVQYQ